MELFLIIATVLQPSTAAKQNYLSKYIFLCFSKIFWAV
ncbi:hypothetical protein AC70_4185 [Escherichia coli 2-210-07_S4_C1]|nr:hypothetical protein AC70_4185 [Escherichia coli 2-210-07_S4_C1]